jgi:fructose-1,6-bisphosphatase II / sedoheptulose-1,7-bisphosphatase
MLDLLRIAKATENAAIACYNFIGKGNEKLADKAAVDAMRQTFNQTSFRAKIVIGEGERDEAPMLYIGEEVGLLKNQPPQYDIAVDPLEGTTICAKNMPGSLSVMAISEAGGLLHAPDVYMDKIASYIPAKEQIIDLDESISINLKNIAKYKNTDLSELSVIVLDRPRHHEIIAKIREAGARVTLISDGDIAAVLAVAMKQADLYLGIGGAPEGVLAAAALKTLGGQMMGRLIFKDDFEREKAKKTGITDLNKKYHLHDMVSKNAIFCATGVTTGPLLSGVEKMGDSWKTNSLILSSDTKQIMNIENLITLNKSAPII